MFLYSYCFLKALFIYLYIWKVQGAQKGRDREGQLWFHSPQMTAIAGGVGGDWNQEPGVPFWYPTWMAGNKNKRGASNFRTKISLPIWQEQPCVCCTCFCPCGFRDIRFFFNKLTNISHPRKINIYSLGVVTINAQSEISIISMSERTHRILKVSWGLSIVYSNNANSWAIGLPFSI